MQLLHLILRLSAVMRLFRQMTAKSAAVLELKVSSFVDYLAVAQTLCARGLVRPGGVLAALIGCSGHSPIPLERFEAVVATISSVLVERVGTDEQSRISLWGGGDPPFKQRSRGRNIADVCEQLVANKAVAFIGAVQVCCSSRRI